MAKELPYFKFFVSEWILGRISDKSDRVQGAFIVAICHYWHKNCDCFITEFKKKIGKSRYDLLINLKFIEEKNDKIFIKFLDEQFTQLSEIHPKRVKSGQAGGEASAEAKRLAKVKHLDKDKEEDKIKKIDIDSLFNEISSSQIWMEEKSMLLKSRNVKNTERLLKNWLLEQGSDKLKGKEIEEIKRHFVNSIKLKPIIEINPNLGHHIQGTF